MRLDTRENLYDKYRIIRIYTHSHGIVDLKNEPSASLPSYWKVAFELSKKQILTRKERRENRKKKGTS